MVGRLVFTPGFVYFCVGGGGINNPSLDFDQKCPDFFKGDRFSPNFSHDNFDTLIPLESKLTAECQGCLCDVARRREELVRDGDEPVCVGGTRGELLERVEPRQLDSNTGSFSPSLVF